MKFKVSYEGILPKSVMLDEVGYVRDDVVTQLRAELEQERELADRLASGADNVEPMDRSHSLDDALADWRTRRNK